MSHPLHDGYIAGRSVVGAINALPEQYRTIVMLVLVQGESYEETARRCDCPIGTIKTRVNRGRQMVMATLGVNSVSDLMSAG